MQSHIRYLSQKYIELYSEMSGDTSDAVMTNET